MERFLQSVDFSDPTTEMLIVVIVGAIALFIFWRLQGDKGAA
jgi:hypothetical protein